MAHFGFVSTKEAFKGCISGKNHSEIANIEYDNSSNNARLLITMGDDSIKLTGVGKYLAGTAGDFLINGEKCGRYDNTKFSGLFMSNRDCLPILQVEEDDSERRFLWAYRQGETPGNAKAWSRPRYAQLLGGDYALASIICPTQRPVYFAPNMSFELMNSVDEELFYERGREEQLCILVCCCWWLCDQLHHVKSGMDPVSEDWRRVSVPSTLRIGKRLTFLPENLPRRNPKVEFLSTQPVFMWLWIACALILALVIFPLCQGSFSFYNIAFLVFSIGIPVCWIVFCSMWSKRVRKRLRLLEEQLNAPKSSHL